MASWKPGLAAWRLVTAPTPADLEALTDAVLIVETPLAIDVVRNVLKVIADRARAPEKRRGREMSDLDLDPNHDPLTCDSPCHRKSVGKIIDGLMYAKCPVCNQKNGANELHDNCDLEQLELRIAQRRKYLDAQSWWIRNVVKSV